MTTHDIWLKPTTEQVIDALDQAREPVTAVLVQAIPPRFGTIAAYNDQPGRTLAELIDLFNSAISIARREVVGV